MMQLILGLGNKARHGKDSFAKAIDAHYASAAALAGKHGLTKYQPVVIQRHAFADALYQEVNQWLITSEGKRFRGLSGILLHKHYIVEEGTDVQDVISPGGIYLGSKQDKKSVVLPDWVEPDPKPEVSSRTPYGKHPKLLQWWGTEYRRTQNPEYWVDQWKAGINPKADIVLATDVRFLNEANMVWSANGFTIQVNRLNLDGTPFVDPSRDKNHVSETQLDGYNFDYKITVKTGDLVLLEEWAITLVHYLRALKGHK
jgi:hypothetical protein